MARLRPQTEKQTAIQQLKPIPQEIEQKIAYTLIKLKSSSGTKDETIKRIESGFQYITERDGTKL